MALAQDLLDRFEELERHRRPFEQHWRDVDDAVGAITSRDINSVSPTSNPFGDAISQRRRSKARNRYDTTMQQSVERLTSGILSLVFPSGQKWHTLSTATVQAMEDEEEKRWAEQVRDVLFFNRYAAYAGFESAIQRTIGSCVRYGPGYLYVQPSFSPKASARYMNIPVNEGYIGRDEFGQVDTFARRFTRKARQVGDWDVSQRVTAARDDPKTSGDEFEFIQIIMPRDEPGFRAMQSRKNAPWVSYIVEVGQKRVVSDDGFETFPVATFFWDEFGMYGTSPCIDYLLEHKMLSAMEKDVLIALNQIVRPPMGVHDTSLMNRVNLNPGAVNPGAVSADGRPLMIPLLQGANPERAAPFIEKRQGQLRDGFYTRLFQTLEGDRGGQTATEVLVRNTEKGQMLGPVGARLHSGADVMVARELEALEMRGLYAENSPLLPPESLADKEIKPQYTNNMQRLAIAGEAEGVLRMMEIDNGRVQQGRTPLLRDAEAGQFLAEAFNAPLKLIKTTDEIAAEDEQRQQSQQQAQAVEATQKAAGAMKDMVPVAEAAGLVPAE